MKVFLAGVESLYPENLKIIENGYNLISFFTMNKQGVEIIKKSRMFLLNSGAYTFLANSKKTACWEDYIEKYANFIKQNNIKNYFELDIDSVIGYENVKNIEIFWKRKPGRNAFQYGINQGELKSFEKCVLSIAMLLLVGLLQEK
jgi:hypothetical protein